MSAVLPGRWLAAAAAVACVCASGGAAADDGRARAGGALDDSARDDKARDDALFSDDGDDEKSVPAAKPAAAPRAATPVHRDADPDAADLGDARLTADAKENTELLTRDRTQIGGFFYQRNSFSLAREQALSDLGIGNSSLFETYFDTRVNDRVRVYARGRVLYSPLADAQTALPAAVSGLAFAQGTDEVRAVLTQLWLKFDVGRTVFVTAGRQFVRFGATRFWNPVDVINLARFNPLTFFDDRVGPLMVKLHVPVESKNWNFYGIVLSEDAIRAEQVGGLLRAEFLVGQTEVGVVGALRKGLDPKVGLDVSSALWELDLTAELAAWFPDGKDPNWQLSAELSHTWAYGEDDTLVVGTEYFHNPQGVTAAEAVHTLITSGLAGKPSPLLPMHTGRDYLGAVATVISPGSWSDSAITALGLMNLTDKSGTAQLNFTTRVLTDLGLEVFGGASFGSGEFTGYVAQFKTELPARFGPAAQPAADALRAPLWRAGVNFRCDL
ncbi:MAG: hypothetical protein FJ100_17380 [Deltaproteobacteria bacterium]|nr:hypothetical protein [Deltaproteobacteria bacterium]